MKSGIRLTRLVCELMNRYRAKATVAADEGQATDQRADVSRRRRDRARRSPRSSTGSRFRSDAIRSARTISSVRRFGGATVACLVAPKLDALDTPANHSPSAVDDLGRRRR